MKINKIKTKVAMHPIMTIIFLIGVTIILSGILSALGLQATSKRISATSLEYNTYIAEVASLFSLSGLKYIFTSTINNFVSFAPLCNLIIVLIGIGVMKKSGFLDKVFTLLTKSTKKNIVTFVLVLISTMVGIIGDISFVIMLPLAAILFEVGKRNPTIGLIASFAGLTCGYGLNVIFTSVDSSLLSLTTLAANVVDSNYAIKTLSFVFIMLVAIILLAILITQITEKYLVYKLDKYEIPETTIEDDLIDKKEKKGLAFAFLAFMVYFLIFLYNIIPGLPFSGKLLDQSQVFYIDKLFSYNSFFSKGFIFVITLGMVIMGLFYGIGARTIKNQKELCEALGHSLDGIGQTIVLIFFVSVLINVVKYTNIGTVIVTLLSNLINLTSFTGIPLIILLFIICAIAPILLPSSLLRWQIISGVAIPAFMEAGISPEFAQVIFRFGESVTIGLTPLFAYFIIYLALLEKYNQKEQPISLLKAIKLQLPYACLTFILLLTILIAWYIVGLPIGIGAYPTL